MSDFEYECRQRKNLASQAKYRKRGSKSKKCTLPSDRMTHKQWKDRCGPVISYNFNKPMEWDEFKKLPTNIQSEYIINLQQKYGVTAVDLGKMFGVQPLTVRKYVSANNLSGVEFHRGRVMSSAKREEWDKFLNQSYDELQEDAGREDCENISGWPVEEPPTEEPEQEVQESMKMRRFSLQFSGNINVNMIANSLKLILGESSKGELEIICNLV